MACEDIKSALAQNEAARTALAARLGPAQNDAQFAFDALQSALRLRTQTLSPNFVASYNGREFRGPNAVEDYIAFVQNDFNTKRDIRRDLGVEFNALFPEKERLEKELAECEARQQAAPAPVASAGTEVGQGQTARDENANTQNPEATTATPTPAGTNATTTAGPTPPAVSPPPPKLPGTTGNVSPPDNTAPTTTLPGTPIPLAGRDLISVVGGSEASQSYIYRATTVTHTFSKGMFTQQLEGALVIYDIPPNTANTTGSTQSEGNAGEAEAAANSSANTANVNPNSVSTPQTPPPAAADTGQASVAPPPPTAPPETVAPAETAPPTSGSEDVSVPVNTTPPPSTIEFAGATLTASLQISGRVFIQLTLPSGATEINVDGWGDAQWDSLLSSTTNSADIAAISSLKASWSSLQSQLRQSVTAPAPATNATPQNMAKEA
jgi:hypothetical protein